MAVLCALLMTAGGFDYWKRKIPNSLVALIFLTGVLFRFRRDGTWGIPYYLGGMLAAMAPLYFFFKIGTLGAGDVKLLGVISGYLPFKKIYLYLFVSLLIAAIISLLKMLANKNVRERLSVFTGYLREIMDAGTLRPYPSAKGNSRSTGVCLSGPMLLSLLLYLGGVY